MSEVIEHPIKKGILKNVLKKLYHCILGHNPKFSVGNIE